MTPISVVVADDHPVVRAGLVALLSSLGDVDVVGVAVDGRSAVDEVRRLRPDVAILDLQMPGLDGLVATREMTRWVPGVAVVVLTMHDDDESVFGAMRAGARGYVVKGAEQDEIARAIRAVAAGEAIFSAGVAERVLAFLTTTPRAEVSEPFPVLSARERAILDLLATGSSNAAIANRLGVATKTVANSLSTIFTKLQVADRGQAIVRARDAGLGRS